MEIFKKILKNFIRKLYSILWLLGQISGCHQLAERSFFVKNIQFPVCARCTGIFVGYLLGFLIFFQYKIPIYLCITFCLIMFLDWLLQHRNIKQSTNLRRFITGTLCGIGYISIFITILPHIYSFLFER